MDESKRLRAMLNERGIKWKKHRLDPDYATNWRASNGDLVSATRTSGKKITLFWETTPEQAIAATVGADYAITFAHTLDRPPETMVGESIFDGEGNHIGWITNTTAGVGTCTIVKTWTDSDYADHWRYSCSECGYQIEVGERDVVTGNPTSHANFCWNCGRRCIGIKEATE